MLRNSISQDHSSRHLNLYCEPHPCKKKEKVCEPLYICDTAFGGFRTANDPSAPSFCLLVDTVPTGLMPNDPAVLFKTTKLSVDYIAPDLSINRGAALKNKRAGKFKVNFNANVTSFVGVGTLHAEIHVNGVAMAGFKNFVDVEPGLNVNFSIDGHISLATDSIVEVKFYSVPSVMTIGFNEVSLNLNFV